MIISYKYKLYHSKKNKSIHSMLNAAGWIWNHSLALQKRYYSLYGKYADVNKMQKHIAKARKRIPAWQTLHSQTVQEIVQRQDASYQRFFKRKQNRPPKFRKSTFFKSFLFKQGGYKLEDNKLTINSIKKTFKFSLSRLYGKPKTVRLYRDRLGACMYNISPTATLSKAYSPDVSLKNPCIVYSGDDPDEPNTFNVPPK